MDMFFCGRGLRVPALLLGGLWKLDIHPGRAWYPDFSTELLGGAFLTSAFSRDTGVS